jgi:hypothetical protein
MTRSAWVFVALAGACVIALVVLSRTVRDGGGQGQLARGLAAYAEIASVLQSPRCLNCHPRGDRPTQGDDMHVHRINVQRGADNNGAPAMRCSACHQGHNNNMAGIPGAPHWHLAPASMGWVGLSQFDQCRAMLDPQKNGGRSLAELVTHLTQDALVQWAWSPGSNRTPPPVSQAQLKTALDTWANAGAPCPN